jgi:hypothetical protein
MDTRLRTWATTGDYVEERETVFDRPQRRPRLVSPLRENLLVGMLVPLGVLVGVFMAAAVLLRLLSLPFDGLRRSGGGRPDRE